MKKRIIISESEKKTILGLYGLIKEGVTPKFKVNDNFKSEDNKHVLILQNIDTKNEHYRFLHSEINQDGQFMESSWTPSIEFFDETTMYSKIEKEEYDRILGELKKSKKQEKTNTEYKKPKEKTNNDSDESVTISGVVKENTIDGKKGVSDATLTFEDTDDKENVKTEETDINGNFKVILPYVGKYKVTVEKKEFQTYSKTFNFNDDITFNIPLIPKKGIIPKIKRKVKDIVDKLKDYYNTRDPKEDEAIVFTKYSDYREKDLWEESESQQEYCRNFTEYYYNFIIETNSDTKNAEQANSWAPDDEKLNQAKNFIMFCKKQYGKKLFASSLETKRKFDKIFSTLQNLPPKVKRYEI